MANVTNYKFLIQHEDYEQRSIFRTITITQVLFVRGVGIWRF